MESSSPLMHWLPITPAFTAPPRGQDYLILLDNGKMYRYYEAKWPKGVPTHYMIIIKP